MRMYWYAMGWVIAVALSWTFTHLSQAAEFRLINGAGNNLTSASQGQANTPLVRLLPPAYEDRIDTPRGIIPILLPVQERVPAYRVSKSIKLPPTSMDRIFMGRISYELISYEPVPVAN